MSFFRLSRPTFSKNFQEKRGGYRWSNARRIIGVAQIFLPGFILSPEWSVYRGGTLIRIRARAWEAHEFLILLWETCTVLRIWSHGAWTYDVEILRYDRSKQSNAVKL